MAFTYRESRLAQRLGTPRVLNPDDIIANGNRQTLCSAQPTNFTQANSTFMLAKVDLTSSDYLKDPVHAVVKVSDKTGVPVTNGGRSNFIAIVDTVHSALKVVIRCNSVFITVPGLIDFSSWGFFY